MALKFFWGRMRMCDTEWLSTLPLWTEPDQLMFWHPGDFNETWMGCWDRPFPKHFRTACFRCQRGMTMQLVRIPENPGASLHLSDFWTDLQLVGRRWHPKGSFSTIFQMIQWYLGIWFVFTGYIGMWGTPQVGRLYTWVWSHVGMPQDTADRLNYWDAVGWPIDVEVFGFPRVRVGSSDGRQVAVKTDNVHARCEIVDRFADWMHRVEPVLPRSQAFVWMFFPMCIRPWQPWRIQGPRNGTQLKILWPLKIAGTLGTFGSKNLGQAAPFFLQDVIWKFRCPAKTSRCSSFFLDHRGRCQGSSTNLFPTGRRERPKVHILQAFTDAQFPLPEASPVGFEWMMDGWMDRFFP